MNEQIKKYLKNSDSMVSLFLGIAVVVVTTILVVNYVKNKNVQTTTEIKKQEEAKKEQSSLPTTHTVAADESLWKISDTYFQSGYNWVDIADANKLDDADAIEVGQTLTIPKVEKRMPEGQTSQAAVEVKKPENNKYTVAKGDSLWSISVKTYGTGYRWSEIASLNKLDDANVIHAGNVLQLP